MQNDANLQAASFGIYTTNSTAGPQIIVPITFSTSFPVSTWRHLPLGTASQSLGGVLAGSEIYLIVTVPSAVPANAYVNVYGYSLV